ncbi:MAG: leucine-rich repeat domain-containing protein [Bacteroidales bacterium]|nr:leucine-rich repeat domain-containing protein [Bacteroidales bacterium]
MDINSIIFTLIFSAYITGGVFIVLWMEENYLDEKYGRKSTNRSLWRVLIWPFLLPVVWPKIRKAKNQEEEEMRQWRAERERRGSIESVVIPDTVTKIEKYAYQDYDNLKSVTIPNSVMEIGRFAFPCGSLKHLFIPASVRKIDPEAFCYKMEFEVASDNPTYEMRGGHLVTKKDNVLVIGNPKEPIPNTVTAIGERALNWCDDEVEEVIVPDSVKKIGDEAFRACANLTKVVIPDSVTEIGSGAFDECDSLTEVHLPASLRKLGMAFDNGPYEGRSIYLHFTDPVQCEVEMLDDNEESTGWPSNWDDWLYVPKGCLKAFQEAVPWCGFDEIREFEN